MNAKTKTILIVEDSPVQAELLRRALEGAGYKVITARNGAEGLAMAKAQYPVAVVSDINMPVMDGYAMCQAIRREESLKAIPVILLTMLSDPQDVISGLNAGADAYVTKPYNVPTLVSRIESLLTYPPVAPPPLERRKVEVRLAGETHLVDAHGPRMLNLLVSTYENAVLQNRELVATQQALENLNQHLEQKVLEKTAALRQSEMELKEAQRIAHLGHWILDSATNQVEWSEELYRMLGLDPTLPPPPYTEHQRLFNPESWQRLSTALPRTLETGVPYELELEMVRGDGSKGWMLARGEPRRDAKGSIVGLHGVAQDISERKRAEAAIVTSETKFRRLFEAARDGILILDFQNGRIVDVNPYMIELLGYTREQYAGKKLWEIGPFKDTAAAKAAFAELQDKKYAHFEDLPLRTADGRDINVEFVSHVYRVNSGEVIQCNIRDITERKRAEEKLARLNRMYATLSGINTTIVHAANPAELFDRVCEVAVTHGRFSVAWIGTVDRAEQTLTPVAQRGLSQDDMAVIRDSIGPIAEGQGRTATSIRERRLIYSNGYEAERATSPWQAEAAKRGIHGSATLPIEQGGEIVGVLKLYVQERNFFDPEQLALLEEMRADISFALDRFDTEAKKAQVEAALRESEIRFRALIENASDITTVLSQDGMISYTSPSIKKIAGYNPDELVGSHMVQVIHPEDVQAATLTLSESIHVPDETHRVELRIRLKDGSWRVFDVLVRNPLDPAAIGGIIVNMRDVTERKLAEATRAELAALVASSRDAIYGTDLNGIVTSWNPGAERIFGYAASEIIGQPVSILAPADLAHEPDKLRQRARSGEAVSDYETIRLHKDGRRIDVAFTISPVLDALGNAVGVSVVARDITERKRAEEELTRLNWALRALGQSNSALVHAGTEKELFQACCDAIAGSEGYPLAWIGLATGDAAHSIAVAAAAGDAVKYLQELELSGGGTAHGQGPTGMAIRTGATQVANNLAVSEANLPWSERTQARKLASAIALPIRADAEAKGVLAIYSREVDAFGRPEIDLFEELAADIGYGIASRRMRTERDSLQRDTLIGAERLKTALIGTIGAVALTVEKRDPYTAGHQQRVAELCVAIGRKLDFAEDRLEGLRLGATIHDIGKIYVPAEILNRPGKLSAPEFEIIKSHPQVGYDIVKDVKFPWPVTDMILQHHERLDGSGYPNRLKGDDIILEARILAVADVVEAMSSHRPYRPGLGLDAALAQAKKEAGTKLDAQVVEACERLFSEQEFAFAKA